MECWCSRTGLELVVLAVSLELCAIEPWVDSFGLDWIGRLS